ncbi:ADM_HP2_G0024870.mRNA.1.CDS.1 [Saccharomyces cerevisiae]|nr:ADM_HP2_G0024870.mRNA.1.CDS.1 [Saccharomyces cerevisiae]CAI6450998.1 ADM_HP2_G0024870.mRNA.1.CDS.1 [Saccharomyces cerevisiae]
MLLQIYTGGYVRCTYFTLAHLQYNAARFFIFLLFLSVYNFCMVSLFALTALIAPTLSMANLLAGILLLAIAMYASYVIYLKDMLMDGSYGLHIWQSCLTNCLHEAKLDCHESIIPRGEYYDNISFSHKACAWQGATLGNDYVRGRDYLKSGLKYTYHHVWRNFGIINWVSSHQYDTDYNIKHPDETVNNHTKESVAMETQKHVISWKNINYTIGDKKLINDASGYISSGLTALMGESGAGKTTLLNVLSQRTAENLVC